MMEPAFLENCLETGVLLGKLGIQKYSKEVEQLKAHVCDLKSQVSDLNAKILKDLQNDQSVSVKSGFVADISDKFSNMKSELMVT